MNNTIKKTSILLGLMSSAQALGCSGGYTPASQERGVITIDGQACAASGAYTLQPAMPPSTPVVATHPSLWPAFDTALMNVMSRTAHKNQASTDPLLQGLEKVRALFQIDKPITIDTLLDAHGSLKEISKNYGWFTRRYNGERIKIEDEINSLIELVEKEKHTFGRTPSPASSRPIISYGLSARSVKLGANWVGDVKTEYPRMEDRTDVLTLPNGDVLFGVYDGHGGEACADYLKQEHRLLRAIAASQAADPYADGFTSADSDYRNRNNGNEEAAFMDTLTGSTATVAHIKTSDATPTLTLAHVGDSRAIIVNRDGIVVYSTEDHKPNLPAEQERIDSLVRDDSNKVVIADGIARTAGCGVSRSIGDASVKDISPGVIATPAVYTTAITPAHDFLILASDGVWDTVDNDEAAHLVHNCLYAPCASSSSGISTDEAKDRYEEDGEDRCVLAARLLRDRAYDKGSSDNIAALVIKLAIPSDPAAPASSGI